MPLIEPLKFRKSGGTVVAPAEMEIGDQIPGGYISDIAGINMLINGDMRINQRVFAGGALAAGLFGYDRWFADAGGATISVSSIGLITHTSGVICQAIEAPRGAFGTTVTVSVGDLSGGNLSINVGGATGTITPGAGRRYVSVVAPAAPASGNLLIKISPATVGVTYREPSVVRGGDMAGFEYRNPVAEMLICQRYYEKSFPSSVAPANNTAPPIYYQGIMYGGTLMKTMVRFVNSKRSTPSLTFYGANVGGYTGGRWSWYNGSAWQQSTADNANILITEYGFQADLTLGSAATFASSYLVAGHFVAENEITA